MDPVRLHQGARLGNALKEKRDQSDIPILGQIQVDTVELLPVGPAIIFRQSDAEYKDSCAGFASEFNHACEIVVGLPGCEAAQTVVAAERNDQDVGAFALECSRKARQAARMAMRFPTTRRGAASRPSTMP